jgi:hypothetical protein
MGVLLVAAASLIRVQGAARSIRAAGAIGRPRRRQEAAWLPGGRRQGEEFCENPLVFTVFSGKRKPEWFLRIFGVF